MTPDDIHADYTFWTKTIYYLNPIYYQAKKAFYLFKLVRETPDVKDQKEAKNTNDENTTDKKTEQRKDRETSTFLMVDCTRSSVSRSTAAVASSSTST